MQINSLKSCNLAVFHISKDLLIFGTRIKQNEFKTRPHSHGNLTEKETLLPGKKHNSLTTTPSDNDAIHSSLKKFTQQPQVHHPSRQKHSPLLLPLPIDKHRIGSSHSHNTPRGKNIRRHKVGKVPLLKACPRPRRTVRQEVLVATPRGDSQNVPFVVGVGSIA